MFRLPVFRGDSVERSWRGGITFIKDYRFDGDNGIYRQSVKKDINRGAGM